MLRYEVAIAWSEEDEAYVARVPELPGCMAHGESYEEALQQIQTAMGLWVRTAEELGRPVPEPRGVVQSS